MTSRLRILPLTCMLTVFAQTSVAQIPQSEIEQRRATILNYADDGIVLLKANASAKEMEQWGWIQNASFYYFSSLGNQPSAILVLDGLKQESHVFVPPAPLSFGVPVQNLSLSPGPESATALGLDSVREWGEFESYINKRLQDGVTRLYLEEPRRPEPNGNPDGMMAVSGRFLLWEQSISAAFPGAEILSITDKISEMRWIKSEAEFEILRSNAVMTGRAMMAGARTIRAGIYQREVESAVVAGCLESGAQGPSFWPWTMAGPNTHFQNLVRSFYNYQGLNREMQSGELVRVDVGCASDFYGGDVGRTFPVSGKFSDEQSKVWDLLISGYLAGIDAMRPGVRIDEVQSASMDAIRNVHLQADDSDISAIANAMLSETSGVNWHVHGVGIESAETPGATLEKGVVLAYEPMFRWNNDSFYLEDMILITGRGAEVLSSGLPYSAAEIEASLSERDEN
ncbi:MAG: M24 family metallopeptidase [Bacteroidetes bacterium]|nr:MAG: M24 family metallopeptidase [Bacteroidota bacterium]